MKDFLGMVRDTLAINNPVGTWQYGRNMVSNKKNKTVANEDGFSFEHLVNGTVIGIVVTNSDIVYFSKNEDGTDEIGVVNTTIPTPIYETKIKSTLFNFQYNCPIEGIFIYNFKKELIVAWSNGVKTNSNKPFILNLDSPPVSLNVNKELEDDTEFTKLYMFPNKTEATLDVEIIEGNKLTNNIASIYITYAYAYDNNDVLPFFSTSKLVHLNEYFEKYYIPKITLTNLDNNFDKLQLGIVVKLKDNTLKGYKSYLYNYDNNTLTVSVDSFSNFIETDVSDILISTLSFDKIETITKQNSQINVGNVVVKEPLDFQKYANLLELVPIKKEIGTQETYEPNTPFNEGSLMPDEVYSIYIELQRLDGTYTDSYHIPGRVAEVNELEVVTATQISNFNLPNTLQDLKQFHVFNGGVIDTKFGYWENEETYPNTNNFDSTVDYDGNALSGGDLRNTPIRYHRVPAKTSLDYTLGAYKNEDVGGSEHYNIGIRLVNFDTIVPVEIKDQIQGYRLSFVKRTLNNSLVLGNLLMANRYQTFGPDNAQINAPQVNPFSLKYTTGANQINDSWRDVSFYGNELFLNQPSINPFYIKLNYMKYVTTNENGKYVAINDNIRFNRMDAIEYAPNNNFSEGTAFREQLNYSRLYYGIDADEIITGEVVDDGAFDVTLISSTKSVYQGFASSSLVIIGKTKDINSPNVDFFGGDVYLNLHRMTINQPSYNTVSNKYFFFEDLVVAPLYSPYNNVKFKLANYPSNLEFDDFEIFYGIVPSDSSYNSVTAELEITGNTNAIINDITTILTETFIKDSINTFPFRIYRSLKISNESLSISSFRSFLVNNYYEMPNDKGEIIALRGSDKKLFIQLKYALFIATIKDTLETGTTKTFLGQSDIFEYPPKEILVDEKGYLGSTSKFACIVVKDMYITVNQSTGQIFIIGEGLKEISKEGNMQWFRNNWKTSLQVDNPYVSAGHLVGFDKEYNRLLFIKKDYEFIGDLNEVSFDGEFYTLNSTGLKIEFNNPLYFTNKSKTLSFSLDRNTWQFEHDYFPNIIFNTHTDLYSVLNKLNGENKSSVYKHNNKDVKGFYYGQKFESYIEVIFNQNLRITKLYQSINWITTVINNRAINQFKTIDKIAIYNDNQCSGIINLNNYKIDDIKTRNNEWSFNNFRDLIKSTTIPVLDENGEIIQENINDFKVWFEKSNFISKFIVVRFIIDNVDNNDVYIHHATVKSVISK